MANSYPPADDPLHARALARVGSVLQERWTLVRLLGLGGAAAVYEARHRNGKRAAVKVLHAVYSGDDQMRQRFLREGYVANKVSHPGVVSVLDDGVDATGAAFLVMDLLEGASLEEYRERAGGALPADEVLAVLAAVLDVLIVAHGAGIVHRDLKPENLFRTTSGLVKVLDFGIARLLEQSSSATATSSRASMGTPAFMPPEQASARWTDVDARSDIWAMGATALILATGLFVHDGTTAMEVLAKAIMYPARPTRERAPDVFGPLAEIIDRALAFDKAHRYPSAASMLEAVQTAQRHLAAFGTAGSASRSAPALPIPFAAAPTELGTVAQRFPSDQPLVRAEPARTEIAVVSSHAVRGAPLPTVHANSQQKRSVWPALVIALVSLVGVVGLVGVRLSRSIRDRSAEATHASAVTEAPSVAAEATTAPEAKASAAAIVPARPELPVEPAGTGAGAPSASPVASAAPSGSSATTSSLPPHTPQRPPVTSSARPPAGVGPLTEQL